MRQQRLLSRGYKPKQPRVLVRLRVNGEDLRSVDVEATEDLAERLFPKPVRNCWVPPERPELRQQLTGAPEDPRQATPPDSAKDGRSARTAAIPVRNQPPHEGERLSISILANGSRTPLSLEYHRAMWSVESTAEIEAAPSAVWRLYANPGTWREWAHSTVDATADGPLEVGAVVRITSSRGPRQRVRIVVLDPERQLVSELALPGARMTFQYEIEPLASGCRVRHRVAMVGPLASAYGWFMRRSNERKLAEETVRLAKAVRSVF